MPVLAWRNDADGYAFSNRWSFDATERNVLSGIAGGVAPLAVGAILPFIPPDPILIAALYIAAQTYVQVGSLPTYGLCGGMAYSSLDHWRARTPLPRGAHENDQPSRTTTASTAVRNMIWGRLLDSLQSGGVLQKTIEWSLLLNNVPPLLGGGPAKLLQETKQEWFILKRHIDEGQPWPIGLVYFKRDIWDQHQILVYGYEDNGDQVTLYVCDSNETKQLGDMSHSVVTLDFSGTSLVAVTPSDDMSTGSTLAGFFCSQYWPVTPPKGLAAQYGQFLTWAGDTNTYMATDGVRMRISGSAELMALGGNPTDIRSTTNPAPMMTRPRDGALLRECNAAAVYLYEGGAPFHIPDPSWIDRFGGWDTVRVVPDGALSAFAGVPADGTLLREWSDPKVYRIENGTRRWVTGQVELARWGGWPTVRLVPDQALAGIPEGPILPAPKTNECATLQTTINKLADKIAKLDEGAVTPAEEAKARREIAKLQSQIADAQTRMKVLGCA
jgi:hypothetical protein